MDIKPPKKFGESTNTVGHFPKLINLLIKSLKANQIQNLGIVADADYVSGGGFQDRWKHLTTCLKQHGYHIPSNPPKLRCLGSIFRHPDLPPIGLWLMPDHESNGMLEDLICRTVKKDIEQDKLLKTAQKCLKQLPVRLFSTYHKTKATVYTWLAWQKRPGQTLDVTINGNLINLESSEMQGFIKWLNNVYGKS